MNIIQSNIKTMSSREIAELTGKQLGHIHRDIKNALDELFGQGHANNPNPNMEQGFSFNDLISKYTCSATVEGIATSVIYVDGAINYAAKIGGGE